MKPKKDDLRLMPEDELGKAITAISRVPKHDPQPKKDDHQRKFGGRPNRDSPGRKKSVRKKSGRRR